MSRPEPALIWPWAAKPKMHHQKTLYNALDVAQNCLFCVHIRSETQTIIFCNVLTAIYKQLRVIFRAILVFDQEL